MQTYISGDSTTINSDVNSIQENSEEQELINALYLAAPLIQKILPIDCMIGIADIRKFINIFYGKKIRMNTDAAGMDIPEQDAIAIAMRENSTVDMIVPKEVYGFEFRSLAIPLRNKMGKVFGGLGIGFDLENSLKVNTMAQHVASSTQETLAVIQELSASAEELANFQLVLLTNIEVITKKIEETNNVLQFINSIASTSKMLGLNAAIEAARAGEQGQGFSVVASEIRKMAEESSKSVLGIKETIQEIKSEIREIDNGINQIVIIGGQQAKATEEMSISTQKLTTIAEELKNASQKVIG